jgi:hypothetical protein
MNKTTWKSVEELKYTLGDARRVSIFSCGVCANLSGTGGSRGRKYLKRELEKDGIEVLCADCVLACCSMEIMKQALRRRKKALGESDALVVISCAGGIKSTYLCEPGLPVIPAADSVGSVPVSRIGDPVANSHCTSCGNCVLAFTGGICPIDACPSHTKYGPCAKYDQADGVCVVDPSIECIWKEIERRGNTEALKELKRLHQSDSLKRMESPARRPSPQWLRNISGALVARSGWFARFVPFVD